MNSLYHLVREFVFFVFIIDILSVYQVVLLSVDVDLQNHIRHKRVYNGFEVENTSIPYVVFLSTTMRVEENCTEVYCTGTLIHPRHVLTLLSCLSDEQYEDVQFSDMKIFLQFRQYDNREQNMNFNIAERVHFKPLGRIADYPDKDNLALILMNDTFPGVTRFPKVGSLQPIPDGTTLSCVAVGFSLIGRNLSRPIIEPIKPMAFYTKVVFNMIDCINNRDITDQSVYLCRLANGPLNSTLCEMGDEGGPLLCKKPRPVRYGDPTANDADDGNTDPDVDPADEDLYVYGLANVVTRTASCRNSTAHHTNPLYLYMYKYFEWINFLLTEFDQNNNNGTGGNETETDGNNEPTDTMVTSTAMPPWKTTSMTSTTLAEYYDTDEYDMMTKKKAIRCDKLAPHPHRSAWSGNRKNAAAAAAATVLPTDLLVVVSSSTLSVVFAAASV